MHNEYIKLSCIRKVLYELTLDITQTDNFL